MNFNLMNISQFLKSQFDIKLKRTELFKNLLNNFKIITKEGN